MIDLDFINRCNDELLEEAEVSHKEKLKTTWSYKNREKHREQVRKYSKTEKGRITSRRRQSIYNQRVREMSKLLNDQELEAVRLFYVNCPPGFEVDHIIPISRGGAHHITNLQYLTKHENRKKGRKVLFIEILDCPECDNPMRAIGKKTRYCDECKKAFEVYYRTEGITREHLMKPNPDQPFISLRKQELRDAYLSANEDIGQLEAIDEWKETLSDCADEW